MARLRLPRIVPIIGGTEQGLGLVGAQPVPKADTQLPGSLRTANAGGRLRAHQAGIGGFVGQSSNGGESQIDGRRGEVTGLQRQLVGENRGFVETQAGSEQYQPMKSSTANR